jgi:glycosyltransferase involved in cell wall biosynthesis
VIQGKKLLKIGYTTIDQAVAKGIIDPARPQTLSLYHNYGDYFEEAHYFVPYGKKECCERLTSHITYEERVPTEPRLFARMLHFLRMRARLLSIMREFNPDVIEICGPHIPAFFGLFTSGLRTPPTVCFLEAYWEDLLPQQTYMPRWLRWLLPVWYRFVYRAFDVYIGAPSLERGYYISKGMDPRRIARWVQEIDLRIIDAVLPAQDPALDLLQKPLICVVGRLHPEKLAREAVDAFCQTAAMGRSGSLVIVGDGSERQELRDMVDRAGLSERVSFLGQLPSTRVLAVMKRCDLMIAPMQGTALLEALACGLAVVAYDHETHRAHICNEENGLLVPHRDIGALAAALSALISDSDRRRRLAAAARNYVAANFSFEKMFDVMNDGFRVALTRRE